MVLGSRTHRWSACAALVIALSAVGPSAAADEATSVASEARGHFEAGVALLKREAWEEALAEFVASRALYPTAKATKNAAICLYRLGRLDEALAMTEALLAFPDLPEASRREAEHDAEELRRRVGTLVLEGVEPAARVEVDGRERGDRSAGGALHLNPGSHLVRVTREGFQPRELRAAIVAGEVARVDARLQPAQAEPAVTLPPSPREVKTAPTSAPPPAPPRAARRFALELDAAALISPTFGGDVAGCSGCSAGPGVGGYGVLRAGMALASGVSFGLAAGGLAANQSVTDRSAALAPVGLGVDPRIALNTGRADDLLKLRGGLFGLWAAYRVGARSFFEARLGAGVLLASVGDRRAGTFHASDGQSYPLAATGQAAFAAFAHVAPEARVGWRVSDHVELSLGLEALVLFGFVRPRWDATRPIETPIDGTATFSADALTGRAAIALLPGLGVRYEF